MARPTMRAVLSGANAADEGAELEDGDGGEIDPFDGEGVQFAEDELKTGGGRAGGI